MTYWVAGAAAVGALVDRKNPLRGAAIGAGTVMTGGAALGALGATGAAGAAGAAGAGATGAGLLGAEAAGAGAATEAGLLSSLPTIAADGTTSAGMFAAQEGGAGMLGAGNLGWGGATTGIQGAMNSALGADTGMKVGGLLGSASDMAKPIGTAMNTAKMFESKDTPPPAPQPVVQQGGAGTQALTQLATNNQQMTMDQLAQEYKKRMEQKQRIAMMGKMYG